MNKNIIWSGSQFQLIENCCIVNTKSGYEINSVIIGIIDDKIVRAQYMIVTNDQWQTTSFHTCLTAKGKKKEFLFRSDAKGNWKNGNETLPHLNGCIDIDISLTPFTNTLPINRLQLKQNEQQGIGVLYIDLLNHDVYKFGQRYTKVDKDKYLYQNLDNKFEALLGVNESGLVENYPGLFKMDKIEEV